jgi:dTDP-4-amino-4,6-dideoxygalactose transaminase
MPRRFHQPISPHLSPNVSAPDLWYATRLQLNPFAWLFWLRGRQGQLLEQWFREYFQVGFVRAFQSGRAALRVSLEGLQLEPEAKVVVQAFTCIVVPEAVMAAGYRPVYVDIDDRYNIDPAALEKLLNADPAIRAVVVQHTFGYPADIEAIRDLCQEHGVRLVEDCAHALGATVNGQPVGSFGDVAMFSFGRDKVVSSVSGGVAITNDPVVGAAINRAWRAARLPGIWWVGQRLRHPLIFWLGKRFYFAGGLGKAIIQVGRTFYLWPLVLTAAERRGVPDKTVQRLPNALAGWALSQLRRLEAMNTHRRELAASYAAALSESPFISPVPSPWSAPNYLRFPIRVPNRDAVLKQLRKAGILLGDWYSQPVMPCDAELSVVGYQPGSCPRAEAASSEVVNLPTNWTTSHEQAEAVIRELQSAVS